VDIEIRDKTTFDENKKERNNEKQNFQRQRNRKERDLLTLILRP